MARKVLHGLKALSDDHGTAFAWFTGKAIKCGKYKRCGTAFGGISDTLQEYKRV